MQKPTKNMMKEKYNKLSKYAQKLARGGSDYWDNMRSVIDHENLECGIREAADKKRGHRWGQVNRAFSVTPAVAGFAI